MFAENIAKQIIKTLRWFCIKTNNSNGFQFLATSILDELPIDAFHLSPTPQSITLLIQASIIKGLGPTKFI